ncbi:hypothetical protein DXG03_007460 [Asterophora parasitica]|uniref:Telomere-associated protein Rif1 N-terminal domain-containing protein n=1 Tax=Asterophora parasitica TaxID=117018 RepID=A0A9P7KBU1_9AGAR|nr:hypothetical protein DXG03_007460 [Asterophora parasitica]
MSLLTPPSTSHRRSKDKENRDVDSSSRVIWSETNKIHILQAVGMPSRVLIATSASKGAPTKSILKKSNALPLPWTQEPQREVTPEPADPLVNLAYLEYPVSTIVQATESTELRVLIEAYSVLMARLRACVTDKTDLDASWPLFQPLRKHRDDFVNAVVRDLGRALVDPAVVINEEPPVRVLLPSPKSTPKKKKRDGMTAEQVKFARDLCTICHAVVRLLSVVLTLPAVMNIFTHKQLGEILTAILAIPLSNELPTPNARKTWALVIWLIQIQRLPSQVLAPAAPRIAMALCRGIDGELGKEGKKGSASDGLKAIHDLSIYLPSVFIPAFTHNVLPSVLQSLLAPTLILRTHAVHALGGFVIGATSLPPATIHAPISRIVATFITTPSPPRPASLGSPTKSKSPQKPTSLDPVIIRTLRTTLSATDVQHVAHGPVWGICVLSGVLALLGPAAMEPVHAPLRSLLQLGLRHRNRSVRALTAVMWRVVIWVFIRGVPAADDDVEGESEADDDTEEEGRRKQERERKARDEWWRLVASVTEFETGICAIAATLGSTNAGVPLYEPRARPGEEEGELELRRALDVLYAMVCKDAPTCTSAIDTMKQLVSAPSPDRSSVCRGGEAADEKRSLLPRSLFSAIPGLLTTEFGLLKNPVNSLFDQTPKAEDVRVLTREEIARPWVWDGLVKAWRSALGGGGRSVTTGALQENREKERDELVRVWEGMVSMAFAAVLDPEEDGDSDSESERVHDADAVTEFTLRAVGVLIDDVLEDVNLTIPTLRSGTNQKPHTPVKQRGLDIPGFTNAPGSALAKLTFARELWRVLSCVVPSKMLGTAAERLVAALLRNAEEYTAFNAGVDDEEESAEEMNEAWAGFCVEAIALCGATGDAMRVFWGYATNANELWTCKWNASERASIWRVFVRGWMRQSSEAGWEGAVCVLGVPFARSSMWAPAGREGRETWKLTSEDASAWQELLDNTVAAALDYGHDANTVLTALTTLVADDAFIPAHIRLVEFAITHLATLAAADDLRELPESVLEFAAATMMAAYPPPPQDQTTYTWLARAVSNLVEQCPKELMPMLGEKIGDATAVWIEDSEKRWSSGVIEYDVSISTHRSSRPMLTKVFQILPLYQTFVICIQGFPISSDTLQTFSAILCAPFASDTRAEIREPAKETFREFWDATYADEPVPKGGWNEEIDICLRAVYTVSGEKSAVVSDKEANVDLQPAFTLCPSTPTTPTVHVVPTTPTTSSSFLSARNANTPSTPPHRSHKPSRLFGQLPNQSPESPMPASRPSVFTRPSTPRTLRTEHSSPAKRRKLVNGNKENLSPIQERVIPSVLERMGILGSPKASPLKVTLGKRRFQEYDGGDSEDECTVVEGLVMPAEEDVFLVAPAKSMQLLPSETTATVASHKKRKRMVLDAVEVMPLSDVYPRLRASASFEEKSNVATRSMRRTRSEAKARSSWTADASPLDSTRKRRRGSFCSTEEGSEEEVYSIGSVPLRELLPWPRRPYSSQSLKGSLPSSELSSDDDPHIGQVTPHRLISPQLRRAREADFSDPPSDDSVLAPSPSRDLVNRRLKRQGSIAGSMRMKPFVV